MLFHDVPIKLINVTKVNDRLTNNVITILKQKEKK